MLNLLNVIWNAICTLSMIIAKSSHFTSDSRSSFYKIRDIIINIIIIMF